MRLVTDALQQVASLVELLECEIGREGESLFRKELCAWDVQSF